MASRNGVCMPMVTYATNPEHNSNRCAHLLLTPASGAEDEARNQEAASMLLKSLSSWQETREKHRESGRRKVFTKRIRHLKVNKHALTSSWFDRSRRASRDVIIARCDVISRLASWVRSSWNIVDHGRWVLMASLWRWSGRGVATINSHSPDSHISFDPLSKLLTRLAKSSEGKHL